MNKQRFADLLGLSVHLPDEKQADYLISEGVVIDSKIPNVDTEVLDRAIHKFGTLTQIDKAIEEMSELTKALIKERHARMTEEHMQAISQVEEELADVIITLNQLIMIFGELYNAVPRKRLQGMVDYKIAKLKERLEGSKRDERNI